MLRRRALARVLACVTGALVATTPMRVGAQPPVSNTNTTKPVFTRAIDPARGAPSPTIDPILEQAGATGPAISTALDHSCALAAGTVRCWGANGFGQLGNGTTTDSGTPVMAMAITTAIAVSVGFTHSCALLASGVITCWGSNANGQLGDSTATNRTTPVIVAGISDATAIAAGGYHSCALRSVGSVVCWGYNGWGQLGDGTTTSRTSPVAVSGLSGVSSLALGYYSSCAILVGGTVRCWGYNLDGQLGNGTTTSSSLPVAVSQLTDATAISAGNYHVCVVRSGGSVACWGSNGFAQLGNGFEGPSGSHTPAPVNYISNAIGVAAGGFHSCALRLDGSVYCWGYNFFGQLGDATFTDRTEPSRVALVNDAVAVSAGAFTTCFTNAGGGRYCVGRNELGQNGNGATGSALPSAAFEALGGHLERVALTVNNQGQVELYGLNETGTIYRRIRYATNNWSPWEQLPGQFRRIGVATTNTGRTVIIGVNDANEIYYRYQTTPGVALTNWIRLPGALRSVAIAGSSFSDNVYIAGLNTTGNVYSLSMHFSGATATASPYYSLPGTLSEVSINALGRVVGISSAGNIYSRSFTDTTSPWTFASGTLSRIAAERGAADLNFGGMYAGTNATQAIYVRANDTWNYVPGQLTDIAVASMPNGAILLAGVNANGDPYVTTE